MKKELGTFQNWTGQNVANNYSMVQKETMQTKFVAYFVLAILFPHICEVSYGLPSISQRYRSSDSSLRRPLLISCRVKPDFVLAKKCPQWFHIFKEIWFEGVSNEIKAGFQTVRRGKRGLFKAVWKPLFCSHHKMIESKMIPGLLKTKRQSLPIYYALKDINTWM